MALQCGVCHGVIADLGGHKCPVDAPVVFASSPRAPKTTVYCTFQVAGYHRWPTAPDWCEYLRSRHRHVFHVKVEVLVSHTDRDLEFIQLKQLAERAFRQLGKKITMGCDLDYGSRSCEQFAVDLHAQLTPPSGVDDDVDDGDLYNELPISTPIVTIEVSEDGENGARVVWE